MSELTQNTSGDGGGDVIREVERLLTNLQPHILQACIDKHHAKFIDNYVDPALALLRQALAAPAAKGGTGATSLPRFGHIASGREYEVVCENAQIQTNTPLSDYDKVVVYRGIEPPHLTWVRPVAEFNDGRFKALAASPPPPAGDAGGSGPLNWTLSQETRDQIAEIDRSTLSVSYKDGIATFAGAAGGGSGDLAALSAGAFTNDAGAIRWTLEKFFTAPPSVMSQAAVAIVERLSLRSAPTPDLGAQGEPVAWMFEYRQPTGEWSPIVSLKRPREADYRRNIRPLYEAPATPRSGSGVTEPFTLQSDEGGTFLQSEAGQLFICADIRTVQRALAAIGAPPSQPHPAAQAGDGGGA